MNLFLTLLFNGGIVTKVVLCMFAVSLIFSVGSCSMNRADLSRATHKISALETDIGKLTSNNEILKINQATLKQTNDKNLATIDSLIKERRAAQDAIDALAKQNQREKDKAATARAMIDQMLKDPKNNGKVAPVLAETLKEYNK